MFRIEDAKHRTIRAADGSQIVTVINPTRRVKLIGSGHIDGVTQGYASNAATSASDAAASALAAFNSESSSATSAGQASTSAASALSSKNQAASSLTAAQGIVDDANTALTAATLAQGTAETLNTVVLGSVLDASGHAGAASSSATDASNSAIAAASSATAASNSEDDASKLAITVKGQTYTLSDATTMGYSARHYAETAADTLSDINDAQSTLTQTLAAAQTAAGIASQAQIDAQNTITSIAGSHTDFHERYLGDFTTDPTSGINSAALAAGDLYYNTANQVMRIYTAASGWIDQVTPTSPTIKHTYIFEVGSSQSHVFSGQDIAGRTLSFTEENIDVFLNGARVREDEFVADAATNTVTINSDVTLDVDDNVLITAYEAFALSDIVTRSGGGTYSGAVTFQTQTTFNGLIDANSNVDIDGHLEVHHSGSPLTLDREHTSQFQNQSHSVLSIEENGSSRGGLGLRDGRVYIQSHYGGTDETGLEFRTSDILPRKGGNPQNNTVALGSTSENFSSVHADTIVMNGRDGKTQGLSPVLGDLQILDVGGVAHYSMPGLIGGSGINITKTSQLTTIYNESPRLLAVGYYRPEVIPGNLENILLPDYWHGAVINDWEFQHPEYLDRTSAAASCGFTVPLDRRMLIEYGATMGYARTQDQDDETGSKGPISRTGPMRLRLGCPTLLGSNQYEVSHANGYTLTGEYQQLAGSYVTPASIGYTEFRIEGRWPAGIEGSWSKEVIAYSDVNGSYGPRVAWVRIWDLELTNNP